MRAILYPPASGLSLALAVLGVRTDHAHHAAPMNDLALHADFLYRCPNLHFSTPSPLGGPSSPLLRAVALLITVNDSAASQIVRRQFHRHAISRQNTNEIFAHLPRTMGHHLGLGVQLD